MCWYCEDDISSGIHGKDMRDKVCVYSGTRTHGSGVRRHTVSSDVNSTAVSIFFTFVSHCFSIKYWHLLTHIFINVQIIFCLINDDFFVCVLCYQLLHHIYVESSLH